MPIYDYECPKCGIIEDIWAGVEEYYPNCPYCGAEMTRLISAPAVITDMEPYVDYNMAQEGVSIKNRQHWKQEMKDRGLVEYEPIGPKKKFYKKQRWL